MDVVEQRNWWQDGVTVSEAVIFMDTVSRHIKKGGLVGILVSPLKSIISLKGKNKKDTSIY